MESGKGELLHVSVMSLYNLIFVQIPTLSLQHPYSGVIIKTGSLEEGKELDKGNTKNLVFAYAVGDVPATAMEVLAYIFNFMLPHRIAFSAKTDLERSELETINDHCKVFYVAKRLPPPLNPRDICIKWVYKRLSDGRILISSNSTDHRHVPLKKSQAKGYVRMSSSGAMLLVPSFNGSRCTFRYVLKSDPGGYIPHVITNSRVKLAMSVVWECKVFFSQR